MKRIKFLFTVVCVIAMLFSVASAGATSAVNFGDSETISYTNLEDTLTITVYAGIDVAFAGGFAANVVFDNTKWQYDNYENVDITDNTPNVVNEKIEVSVTTGDAVDTTVTAGQTIMKLKFKPVAGKTLSDLNNTVFRFDDDGALYDTEYNELAYSGSIKVVTSGGSSTTTPSVGTVDVTNKGTELTDNNGKKWKDVPTFEISAPITGKASSITAAITANDGTKDFGSKTYTFAEIEDATLKFRIAVVGVPEGTTVTLDTPGITIN